MTDATALQDSLPHAVFLRRLSGAPSATSPEARLGQGALLALRLLDLLTEPQPPHPDAFQYQRTATELLPRAAAGRDRDRPPGGTRVRRRGRRPGERRAARAPGAPRLRAPPRGRAAVRLRMARALRKLNEFDHADWCYAQAGALAAAAGDRHSELVSRLGGAYTLIGRGNLVGAERRLREVLPDAERWKDRRAQALAHQGLGVVLSTGGRPADAIPHTWRAFELYDDALSRFRVLSDLGVLLLTVGDADGAERALLEVVKRGSFRDVEQNVLIELMHCASYRRDRVGFERWRERCEAEMEDMLPNICADFHLKLGIGRARFGQFDRAELALDTAL